MKSFFYTILVCFIVLYVIHVETSTVYYELPKEVSGIVIDKHSSNFFGDNLHLLDGSGEVNIYNCYDILFDNIAVGDTIRNGKILNQKR